MNREIEFRAECINTNEWVYGCYGTTEEQGDNGGIEHHYRETLTQLHYIVSKCGSVSSLVYPDTVGQFTGLYDCKKTDDYPDGQKIFEDDIVSNVYGIRAKVVFIDGSFKLHVFNPPYGHKRITDIMNFINTSCLVVGNIHDK